MSSRSREERHRKKRERIDVQLNFRCSEADVRRLKKIARACGWSKSRTLRVLLQREFARVEAGGKPLAQQSVLDVAKEAAADLRRDATVAEVADATAIVDETVEEAVDSSEEHVE